MVQTRSGVNQTMYVVARAEEIYKQLMSGFFQLRFFPRNIHVTV